MSTQRSIGARSIALLCACQMCLLGRPARAEDTVYCAEPIVELAAMFLVEHEPKSVEEFRAHVAGGEFVETASGANWTCKDSDGNAGITWDREKRAVYLYYHPNEGGRIPDPLLTMMLTKGARINVAGPRSWSITPLPDYELRTKDGGVVERHDEIRVAINSGALESSMCVLRFRSAPSGTSSSPRRPRP